MGIQVTSFPITRSGIIGFPCRERSLYFHVSCLGYQWLQSTYTPTFLLFLYSWKLSVLKSLYRGVDRSSGFQVLTKIKWGWMYKKETVKIPNQSPHKFPESDYPCTTGLGFKGDSCNPPPFPLMVRPGSQDTYPMPPLPPRPPPRPLGS